MVRSDEYESRPRSLRPLRCFHLLEDVKATITSTSLTVLHEVVAHRDHLARPLDVHLG
jgi:hypothetical protein